MLLYFFQSSFEFFILGFWQFKVCFIFILKRETPWPLRFHAPDPPQATMYIFVFCDTWNNEYSKYLT